MLIILFSMLWCVHPQFEQAIFHQDIMHASQDCVRELDYGTIEECSETTTNTNELVDRDLTYRLEKPNDDCIVNVIDEKGDNHPYYINCSEVQN